MSGIVPAPSPDDRPFCEAVTVDLSTNEEFTATYYPSQNDAMFRVGAVAMSKRPESEYEVWMDQERVYGPSSIPPTDIDDMAMTFLPARGFRQSMTVIVRNLKSTTGTRRYSVQPVGYEVMA